MNNINIFINITFDNPYLLLLMIPLIALAFIPYLRLKPKRRHTRNKVTSLILHCLIIILSCFVLSGISGTYKEDVNSEIVLVTDYSYSTFDVHNEMNDYINSFIDDPRNSSSKIGLVYFGYGETRFIDIDYPSKLKGQSLEYSSWNGDSSGTDIENALIKAVSLFDSTQNSSLNKRIILLSDAIDTDGKLTGVSSILNQNKIRLDAIFFEPKDYSLTSEAQINGIDVEKEIPFIENKINITFASHNMTSVNLKVTDNGKSIFDKDTILLNLSGKSNETISYDYVFKDAGLHEIKAEIASINNSDLVVNNNIFYTSLYLEAENSILIIAPENSSTSDLVNTIKSLNYSPNVIAPKDAPSAQGLTEYKEVILMDTSVASFPTSFANSLKSYIEGGGSVLYAGGENTYANGNMINTLYEDMMPISLTPTANNPRAIVLCLDYSNSMGMKSFSGTEYFNKEDSNLQKPNFNDGKETRIEVAIKGIVESIKSSLNPYDYLSLITFGPTKYKNNILESDETRIVFPLTPATQKTKMIEQVEAITKPTLEGGTDYDFALEYAEEMLSTFPTKVNKKSVVLINDYDSGNDDAKRYKDTIKSMKEKNIDFSSIVIGNNKSQNLTDLVTENIVSNDDIHITQTEAQFATVIKELCKSIPTEVVNNLKTNGKFQISDSSILKTNVDVSNLPLINTYNGGVSSKDSATTHVYFHNTEVVVDPDSNKNVTLDNNDPIYVDWSPYGSESGLVGCLMIDLSSKFCPELYTNQNSLTLLKNIITRLIPSSDISLMRITIDGLEISDDPSNIETFNLNYTRNLRVELLGSSDSNEEVIKNITLDIVISKLSFTSETMSKTKVSEFSLSGESSSLFEKDFITREEGIYEIEVSEKENNDEIAKGRAYTSFSYSDEYDTFFNSKEKLNNLSKLCSETFSENEDGSKVSGKIYYGTSNLDDNVSNMITSITRKVNFQLPLMIIALLLFILDIAVRKFNFLWPHEIIDKIRHKDKKE